MSKEDDEQNYSSSSESSGEDPEAFSSNEEFYCKDCKGTHALRWTRVYADTSV